MSMKNLFNQKTFLAGSMTALLLSVVSCGPAKNQGSGQVDLSSGAGLSAYAISTTVSCSSDLNSAQIAQAKLVGPDITLASSSSSFKLTGAEGCPQFQKSLSFKQAGIYTVSANLVSQTTGNTALISAKTTVLASAQLANLSVQGPQVSLAAVPATFSLMNPDGIAIQSADWSFGDGSATISSLAAQDHAFASPGEYIVNINLSLADGSSASLHHNVTVIPYDDFYTCANQLTVTSPSEALLGTAVNGSVSIPACLKNVVSRVDWNFGDNTATSSGTQVSHTFSASGVLTVTVSVYSTSSSTIPWFTYHQDITVLDPTPVPTPSPTPTPAPSPAPTCILGEQREVKGATAQNVLTCGVAGHKTQTLQLVTIETCQLTGETLGFVKTSSRTDTVAETACLGQSCALSDGSILLDGGSKLMFSSSQPAGACSAASQTRICNNGTLSGSADFSSLSCHSGCDGFGPNGTIKTGQITGEISAPAVCQFGETGFQQIFNEISDLTCNEGQIVKSNSQRGSLKTPAECPSYHWQASDSFTTCSADCGGTQNRIFECRDNKGNLSSDSRCLGTKPQESRACDANPEKTRRSESVTTEEQAPSSASCPKNQIGVITNTRNVTTTRTFACIDHKVQIESEKIVATAWESEKYCRDYVAHRCSQDSLNNTEAQGRYKWMVKCADKVPAIKEFLDNFGDVKGSVSESTQRTSSIKQYGINSSTRTLYPTFMNTATKPEKPWIAPKSDKSGCDVPNTAYVAAVCVSSCATPEQQILAQVEAEKKMKYIPFIEALQKNVKYVNTMKSESSLESRQVTKTSVQQWVTELIDTEHEILVFTMKSGGVLKVTPNHPLLGQDGRMRTAAEFTDKDSLVLLGGQQDPVLSIEKTKYVGKVYNLFVNSEDPKRNVVVTNGYLNGTAFFQNEGSKNLNRELFKDRLIKGVFEK